MSDRGKKPNVIPLTSEDRPKFARAYREHYAALHAFVRRRVGTDAEAADIAQETYLRVLRYRDKEDAGAVKALLYRIAMNLLGIRARVARTHQLSNHIPLDDELSLIANDPPQDRQAEGEQEFARLTAVVEKLPRNCREVFVLSRFQGLTRSEVAAILKLSTRAVDRHLSKAIDICRKKLGDEDL